MSQSFTQPDLTDKSARQVGVVSITGTPPLPTNAATETTLATLAQEGTAITGATMPTGGAHVTGWLSAIWKALTDRLPAALGAGGGIKVDGSGTALPVSGTFWQATQPVSGTVATTVADGADGALGALADDKTAPSLLGRVANVVSKLAGGLPSALGAGGGLKVDGSGTALPVSGTLGAASTTTSGTFTAAAQSVGIACTGYGSLLVGVSGTYTGAAWVHELSIDGGSTYPYQVFARRAQEFNVDLNMGTVDNLTRLYEIDCAGATHYRLRCTNYASGTVAVQIGASATAPSRMVAAGLMDSQTGNTPITSQSVGGNRALHVAGATIQSGATTGNFTASGQTITQAASASTGFLVSIRGTFTNLSFVFEISPDGSNWYPVIGTEIDTGKAEYGWTVVSSATQIWLVYAPGQNTFRVRSTAFGSGTANVTITSVGLTAPLAVTVRDGGTPLSVTPSLPFNAASESTLATLAQEGTAITGATMPTGGAHLMGWLSAIWTKLNGGLPAALGANGGLKVEGISGGQAVPVSQAPLTKGTQGSTGVSTQDQKDAGRTYVALTADSVTPAASDTLVTFVKDVGGTETTGQTDYTVTTGKTLRIQAIHATLVQSSATAVRVRLYIRASTSGAVSTSTPKLLTAQLGPPGLGTSAANTGMAEVSIPIPDGLELAAAGRIGITALGTSAAGTLSVTIIGYEY